MKGYKGFNKDMTCRGMQYEEGKIYKMEEEPKCCEKGYHFCENPLDTLDYYDLCDSAFAEVEAIGDINRPKEEERQDSKIATNKIKIGAKLDLTGFIKASIDFLWEKCKIKDKKQDEDVQASSGDYSQLASSGDNSKLASSGYNSKLASSGDYSQLASSGDNSKLASSGYNSKLASSGDNSKLASSGYNSKLASSGDNSKLASSGDYSQLASSGDYSQLASSGYYSNISHDKGIENVVCNIGIYGKARGIKGDILVLAEYKKIDSPKHRTYVYKPICVKSKKIDGKFIKENTYYKLENKKFVEVEDDND
jgi:hypothetical protein